MPIHHGYNRIPRMRRYGKKIEENVIASLRMAGLSVTRSADLDHNHKVDFVLRLGRRTVGVQVSLRNDLVKVATAKLCALEVVDRFVYLRIAPMCFVRPSSQNGRDLNLLLDRVVAHHPQPALRVDIFPSEFQVTPI